MTAGMVLAIDPGPVESGWCLIDATTRRPVKFGKHPNGELLASLRYGDRSFDHAAVEMVASYGMPVGAEVFDTCVWVGRFTEAIESRTRSIGVQLVPRSPIKVHHCRSSRANDANIRQALVDRFASGASNHGKGTKASPAWFYGFRADVWQAYALAVLIADSIAPAAAATGVTA